MITETENQQNNESKYLKPYQYYADIYDRHTVEECRRLEKGTKPFPNKKLKTKAQIEKAGAIRMADMLLMKTLTGERYAQKKSTIDKWMTRDEKKDRIFVTAQAPGNITCLICGRLMFVESKHMWGTGDDEDKVLFFYDCPLKHVPRRAFYHDGEEWKAAPHPCPKCGTDLERKTVKESIKGVVFVDHCSSCGYTHKDKLDLTSKKEKIDPDFARDRGRFCLSDKDGEEYIDFKYKLKGAIELMEQIQKREDNKDGLEKVAKLKKLKIVEVEQLLAPMLEKQSYIKLQFQSPEIKRDVIVSFTVHDAKDRSEQVSMADLKKILKESLKETNWRLMSDGVDYRLGMLNGRLRAYEREEDLLELVSQNK